MRYLRMLTNSVIAGALGAAYLTVVVLQLNPHLGLEPREIAPLYGTLALFYGAHLAVIFYGLMVVGQLFASEVLSPGWLSVRVLSWAAAGAATAAAAVMWMNLRGFGTVLDSEPARRMAEGALAMSASAAVLVAIALVHQFSRRRATAALVVIFVIAVGGSLALPVAERGRGVPRTLAARRLNVGGVVQPPPAARVVMLLVDGASLDYISTATAAGRLPNFGKILDRGAAMHLATLRPTQPEPVWSAVATGKYPPKNGIRAAATYHVREDKEPIELLPDYCYAHALVHLGFLTEVPHTSAALRARPLWHILGDLGISVGVVAWPLTYPAQPVRGYLVSERFHQGTELDTQLAYPPEAIATARAAAGDLSVESGVAQVAARAASDAPDWPPSSLDRTYQRIAADLQSRFAPQFVALRYQGLDLVGHYFLRYAMPRSFGDVPDEQRRRLGQVLDRYYGYIDSEVGAAIDALAPDDLLLVVSGFGMEPVSLGKRLLERVVGDPDLNGTHEGAPDGFLLAYGSAVSAGRVPRGSIVDVAPTVLYFLAQPAGRDMDGYARTDIFRRTFTAARPITFIPSYDR